MELDWTQRIPLTPSRDTSGGRLSTEVHRGCNTATCLPCLIDLLSRCATRAGSFAVRLFGGKGTRCRRASAGDRIGDMKPSIFSPAPNATHSAHIHRLARFGSSVMKRLMRSEEHTSELQSPYDLVCRL